MSTSLKELRELSRNLDIKKREFQKSQTETKLKEQWQLHDEAIKSKNKIQKNLGASSHIHLENFISRIRFDYAGLIILFAIIAGECIYLHKQGIINSPMQRARYQIAVSTDENNNRIIAATVDRLMQEVKSQTGNSSLSQLFSTVDREEIDSFISETDSVSLKTIVYVKNENCYYASALTDKDRNITFRLNRLEGDYKVSLIDIED